MRQLKKYTFEKIDVNTIAKILDKPETVIKEKIHEIKNKKIEPI